MKKVDVWYHQWHNMGRRYATGYSMQRTSKTARAAAFGKIGYDVDMRNACFSILGLELKKNNVHANYPIIYQIQQNPIAWRTMISELYDESAKNGQLRLIKTLFGSLPNDDNPYLWKLSLEVIKAAKYLLELPENQFISSLYSEKKVLSSPACSF